MVNLFLNLNFIIYIFILKIEHLCLERRPVTPKAQPSWNEPRLVTPTLDINLSLRIHCALSTRTTSLSLSLSRRFVLPSSETAGMGSKQKRPRPKLERRNAIRNVDYYAPPSPSSTFDHDESSPASGIRSRSLDLYPKQTSFRVRGIEGEFELICHSLGLSGPDDFSIPAAAWEAQKARSSSDLASRSRLRDHTSSAKPAQPEPEDDFSAEFQARVRLSAECAKQSSSSSAKLESRLKVISDSVTVGPSGGIKGSRPPFLSPPPVLMRPVVDNVSSTWDILNSFAPRDDVVSNPPSRDADVSFSDEDEATEENGESSGEIGKREESRFQSCSPRSNDNSNANDDHEATIHTSSVIMVYTISPSGHFRRSITSWQKGELLGSGSFGTVYEGFTE